VSSLDAFISIDIESTGTDPLEDRIIELGICEFTLTNGQLTKVKSFAKLFNPGIPIAQRATEVHGIRNEHVSDKLSFASAAPKLAMYITGKIVSGYNLYAFDAAMLKAEFARAGIARPFDGVILVDSYPYVREDYGVKRKPQSKRLVDQCNWWGVPLSNAHSAAHDAEAAGRLLLAMQCWPASKPVIPYELERIIEDQRKLREALDQPIQVEMKV